jgi:hypothetical protein
MKPLGPSVEWAADRGHLRASAADRELVIEALKAAFVQGRLSQSELDRRAIQALEARTYAGLTDATAGIPPATPAATARSDQSAPAGDRPVRWKVVAWALSLAIVVPGLSVAFVATYYGSFFILLSLGFIAAAALGSPSDRRPGPV